MSVKDAEQRKDSAVQPGVDVQKLLRAWKRRLFWQRLLYTATAATVILLTGYWLSTPTMTQVQQLLALCIVSFAQLCLSAKWRNLSPDNFLQHLNRRFPDFEESAQLLTKEPSTLRTLQLLQHERVATVYEKNLAQVERWQAPLYYRGAVTLMLICGLLLATTDQLALIAARVIPEKLLAPTALSGSGAVTNLTDIAVRIQPPAYTGLKAIETDQLDLELPQGSQVNWSLSVTSDPGEFALLISPDVRVPLAQANDNRLQGHAVIDKTGLYRIVRNHSGEDEAIGNIYSLAVTLDQPPDIRIIEPAASTLEIPKTGPAVFNSQVLVKDDYGVAHVDILASVAKGSGEGVKFRDERLEFDRHEETDKGLLYQKSWDLEALGMVPGDEVYFTVTATDNRLPEANTGRSETLIVRWLDDDKAGLAAEGLAIDFIPEFFKSQRQIIIDTEQLIEDKPQLDAQAFKDISYETGQAQADLKQKYGQYLGDEFGEGPGGQINDLQGKVEQADESQTHEHDDDDHGGDVNNSDMGQTLNNMADIVRLFGHDHGDPEIGPITKGNPVALMKRAVKEMWQAEKHLMQAEPELALPFEYEAYKYLKLARQADRIYVKRLGFIPPPVTEERRLSGELDEIRSYSSAITEPVVDPGSMLANQTLLKFVYQLLTSYSSQHIFSDLERGSLSRLSLEFTKWSQSRPVLIRHAASLEKLSLAGQLRFDDCDSCLQELQRAVWQQITEDAGQLVRRNAVWHNDDQMIKSYQQRLKQEATATTPLPDQDGGSQ